MQQNHVFLDVKDAPENELCSIMKKYGSDKGGDWHNYTRFYYDIFDKLGTKNIFELGLGTNNITIPSNMGADGVPGASHRGWKEWFPNAMVWGADIDKNILFSDDRIQTFYVDQTNPLAIRELVAKIPDQDIIIDDGLHTFEANHCFWKHMYTRVKPGGMYVIEDINLRDFALFESHFDEYTRYFEKVQIVELSSNHNKLDNALVVMYNKKPRNVTPL